MENITSEQLEQLQSEGKKILVDYHAIWCGPCKSLVPRLEQLSTQYPDVTFVKIDVDQNRDYCVKLGIRSVPTIMIFNGDELINRSNGASVDSYYKEFLDKL